MKTSSLTQERLKEVLRYDPDTGLLTRLASAGTVKAGTVTAGGFDKDGYRKIAVDGCTHQVHRLAVLYMTGKYPTVHVDHRDHDKSNNRWKNLREATVSQNKQNSKLMRTNTSGVKGVHWCKTSQKWRGEVKCEGERKYGYFETLSDAASFVREIREKHHLDFACHE